MSCLNIIINAPARAPILYICRHLNILHINDNEFVLAAQRHLTSDNIRVYTDVLASILLF